MIRENPGRFTVTQSPTTTRPLAPATPGSSPSVMPPRNTTRRLNDWYEVYAAADPNAAQAQGGRCISCGTAFCMPDSGYAPPGSQPDGVGCPIANKIPEWNELVQRGRWRDAYDRLSQTNPFPEFTSRICPAPCQDACILAINESPVQIKGVERAIIDRAFNEGWVQPPTLEVDQSTGRHIAIVGSGPAGLTAADSLIRRGHMVTVYERSDRAGGLLTYGVPNMKLDKAVVQRRLDLLARGGIRFVLNADVGFTIKPAQLRAEHDAILLAVGAHRPRQLELPGADLRGVHPAMKYLTASTRTLLDNAPAPAPAPIPISTAVADLDAAGKDVVVIGGGDTGADCIATALRQGCRSMINITRRTPPPPTRDSDHPWPGPPDIFTLDYAHAEGRARFGRDPREFAVGPQAIIPDPADPCRVAGVLVRRLNTNTTQTLPAQLVLLAVGVTGHDASPLAAAFGLPETNGRLAAENHRTAAPGVYVAGDCRRGASLIVWAIREGRDAARAIHDDLR